MDSRQLVIVVGFEEAFKTPGADHDELMRLKEHFDDAVIKITPKLVLELKRHLKLRIEHHQKRVTKQLAKYQKVFPFSAREHFYQVEILGREKYIQELKTLQSIEPSISLSPADVDDIKTRGLEHFVSIYADRFYPPISIEKVENSDTVNESKHE